MHKEIKQNKATFYAKILIIISILLMITGFFLDYSSKTRLINPKTDIKESTNNDIKGTESTIEIHHPIGNVPIEIETIYGSPAAAEEEYTTSTQTDYSVEYSSESTDIGSIDEYNNSLRNKLQDEYGITIKYGAETEGYEVGDLTTISISNANLVNSTLTKLEEALSLYPEGIFKEIRDGGIPLTLYLVDRYSTTGVTGVTDSNVYFAHMSIAVAYPFEESFFHESYHYLERYMIDRKNYSFTSWEAYNPPGFSYGTYNYELSYASNGKKEDSYFVNNYAQTSDAEDRASTFEYMMDINKVACLNKNQPVWKKAKVMSQAIDATFNSCSPYITEYWERFL
ncbi:MAG: hypothetical protein IJG68_01285 [Bacilli bacterium]|nr:hypothetical protein [Bacilli bacterium]